MEQHYKNFPFALPEDNDEKIARPPRRNHFNINFGRIQPWLFIIFIIIICVSYFDKSGYKSVDNINSEALAAPSQTPVTDQTPITFTRNNYDYTLTPLYNYTLGGLVLHTQKYNTWYSIDRVDKTFIKDVCIIWGKTLENKGYQEKTLSVTQDYRFCLYRYNNGGFLFNLNELSNNHLIASSPAIEKQILSVEGGDQIKLTGKLVNVNAVAIDKTNAYESPKIIWNTSINRDDSGAGACEIMYVERVEIIKKGNWIFHLMYSVGWYGLFITVIWFVAGLIFSSIRMKFNKG